MMARSIRNNLGPNILRRTMAGMFVLAAVLSAFGWTVVHGLVMAVFRERSN